MWDNEPLPGNKLGEYNAHGATTFPQGSQNQSTRGGIDRWQQVEAMGQEKRE